MQDHTQQSHHAIPGLPPPEPRYVPIPEDGEPYYGEPYHSEPYYGEPILTHHHLSEYKPYHYDTNKIPDCALVNAEHYNISFCLQDKQYPV